MNFGYKSENYYNISKTKSIFCCKYNFIRKKIGLIHIVLSQGKKETLSASKTKQFES